MELNKEQIKICEELSGCTNSCGYDGWSDGFMVAQKPKHLKLNPYVKGLVEAAMEIDRLYGQNLKCAYCDVGAGDGHIAQCKLKSALENFKGKAGEGE